MRVKPIDPIFAPIPFGDDRQPGRTRRGLHHYLEFFLDPNMVYCHCMRKSCGYRWKIPKLIYIGFGTGGMGEQNSPEKLWPIGATGSGQRLVWKNNRHVSPIRNIGTGGTGQSGLANNYKEFKDPETGIVTGTIGGIGGQDEFATPTAYSQFTHVIEDCHTGGIGKLYTSYHAAVFRNKHGYNYPTDWLEYTFFYCSNREEKDLTDRLLQFKYEQQPDDQVSVFYPHTKIREHLDSTSYILHISGRWTPPKDYFVKFEEFHERIVGDLDVIHHIYDTTNTPSFCRPIYPDSTTYMCDYTEIRNEEIIPNPNPSLIYISSPCPYEFENGTYIVRKDNYGCLNGIDPCDKIEVPLTCDYRDTDKEHEQIDYQNNLIRNLVELSENEMLWLAEYVGYSGGPGDINEVLPSPRAWGNYPVVCPNCQRVSFECYWIEKGDNQSLGPSYETLAQHFLRAPNVRFDFTRWEFCKAVIVRDVQTRISDADADYS